jgi:large subunit ribosomal protein L17
MRHRKQKFQLNRFSAWRKSTVINLAKSLIIKQRIITTKLKAKIAARLTEKLITLAKKGTLTASRKAYEIIGDHQLTKLLFKKIAPLFNQRNSGYTRILPLGLRRGDNAQMVILELTQQREKIKKVKKEKKEEPREKAEPKVDVKEERPPAVKKPSKRFLRGLRSIFKKERDAL